MYLDFAQVLTQIFAFIIVYLVLKRYGWAPLLKIMEDRKQLIQHQFDEIEKTRALVEEMKKSYQDKLSTIEHEGRLQIQEAVKEAKQIAHDIHEEAKKEGKILINQAKEEAARQILEAKNTLKTDMVNISFAIAQKILEQEIKPSNHQEMIADFVEHVELK